MTDKTADAEITARARAVVERFYSIESGKPKFTLERLITTAIKEAVEQAEKKCLAEQVAALHLEARLPDPKRHGPDEIRYLQWEAEFYALNKKLPTRLDSYLEGILEGKRQAALCRVVGPTDQEINRALNNTYPGSLYQSQWDAANESIEWYRDNLTLSPIDVSSILPSEEQFIEKFMSLFDGNNGTWEGDCEAMFKYLRSFIQAKLQSAGGQNG